MSGIGDRIRQRREQLKISQQALARKMGVLTYQAIQAVEKGGQTKHLHSFAKALDVSPEWLMEGGDMKPAQLKRDRQGSVNEHLSGARHEGFDAPPRNVTNAGPEDMLRVLGMAEGGPDGWNLWNGDVVQYIRRPDNLIGVPNAYAVFISGSSMVPRYRQGEIAHIHPGKPINPGDYVLVQRRPDAEGEPPLAVIKLLVRRTASKVILGQHNPEKEIEVKASDVVSIHRVVGSSEG